ncbi:homoserine kinase [Domibacillus aminovorans]|uniref:Homoserine kinase n=1 Tax=Domibacillus aminovorans TaxID=29332 RepID=A0A177KJX9_9BACI|nr:homoserine kinase [Domibacillus aminovorans]OAH52881.1 homoserine kinase [Domibacillus aminovorans]
MMSSGLLKVPASTANLGPGFDSIGLAFSLYLTVEVKKADRWAFSHRSALLNGLPEDEQHLIAVVAKKTAELRSVVMPPIEAILESDIPLARGLGSSAAAIAAGIEIADKFAGLQLTDAEKLNIGDQFEGHPDNIGASLFGGMVCGVSLGETAEMVKLPAPDIDLIALIPPYELKTEDARNVLPASFSRKDAVLGSAVSNMLVAAFMQHDYETAGRMMERDVFHEPFRTSLIKEFVPARELARSHGAYATVISGAGSTVLTVAPHGKGQGIAGQLREKFNDCDVLELSVDSIGPEWIQSGE